MSNQLSSLTSQFIDSPTKSDSDPYSYRVITLENGLTALLASKNNVLLGTGTVQVSLSIKVGSWDDPEEFQGLAYLLMEMIKMGTKTYPGTNDFIKYLEKSCGDYNASAGNDHTTFYITTRVKYLQATLKRFAQFFISPLIKQDVMKKELEAVDSEFNNIKNDDEQRVLSLLKSLGKSGHPTTQFSCGNRKSLIENKTYEDLAKELQKFRLRHYCANRMKLAIRANLSLDNLEKMIRKHFKDVHNNFLPPTNFSEYKNSFITEKFKKMYYVKPVKNLCQVRITWPIPSEAKLYRYKASDYICRILEYKGPGSLLAYLRNRMWALSVELDKVENMTMLTIKILLTHQGMDRLDCVLDAVFSFLALLKQNGPCECLFKDLKIIRDKVFKYDYEVPNIQDLSKAMLTYEPSDYLTGPLLFFEYNEELIRNVIDVLNPETCNIIVHDYRMDTNKYTKTEKWFGTKYTYKGIPENWRRHWINIKPYEEFSYPLPNKFIANEFHILERRKVFETAEIIYSNRKCVLWYNNDIEGRPKADLFYLFETSFHLTSAKYFAMLDLYVEILKFCTMEELYFAEAAFLRYFLKCSERGFELAVDGLSDKVPLLADSITEKLIKCVKIVSPEIFENIKLQMLHTYHDCLTNPFELVADLQNTMLLNVCWNMIDRREVVMDISLSELQVFVNEFYASAIIHSVVEGNISKEKSLALLESLVNETNTINDFQDLNSNFNITVSQLPRGEQCLRISSFIVNNSNSTIRTYYQIGLFNIPDYCMLILMIKMLRNPLIHQLQTIEQLGYYIFCGVENSFGMLGFEITVHFQEYKFRSSYVQERIEVFVQNFKRKIMKNKDGWCREFVESLVAIKKEAYTSTTSEDRLSASLKEEIDFLQSVTGSDIKSWFLRNLNPDVYKKITIQIVGHNLDASSSCGQ